MGEQIKEVQVEINQKNDHENWNHFFSRLAHAENAAANQCNMISKLLSDRGLLSLAEKYEHFAAEEQNHFNLVRKICKPLLNPPAQAERVYNGAFMNKTTNPLERMACLHLVFEPAALAFLGFFHQHAKELIEDQSWTNEIKQSFREILQDEVGHVYGGASIIKSLLRFSSASDIVIAKRAMRRHRAFIIAGIKEMFKNSSNSQHFVKPMISRFNWYYAKASEGVFA